MKPPPARAQPLDKAAAARLLDKARTRLLNNHWTGPDAATDCAAHLQGRPCGPRTVGPCTNLNGCINGWSVHNAWSVHKRLRRYPASPTANRLNTQHGRGMSPRGGREGEGGGGASRAARTATAEQQGRADAPTGHALPFVEGSRRRAGRAPFAATACL